MPDLTDAEARVLAAVDAQWAVDRLRALVAVPSVGGTAAECDAQHLVGDWLEELGCAVDRWDVDLAEAAAAPDRPGQEVTRTEAWGVVGTAPAAEKGVPALVLAGHTDVVPPGDPDLWPAPPFDPRVAGGAVHGRGACDMKAGVVASLAALAAVRTAGCGWPGPWRCTPSSARRTAAWAPGPRCDAATAVTCASSPSRPPAPS